MTCDATELKRLGIDENNSPTINAYEKYLGEILPPSETIRDMFIDVNMQLPLSDLYCFTGGLMIEIPDFMTFYDGKPHTKKMTFTAHPIRNSIVYVTLKKSEAKGSEPRSVQVDFMLKTGATFSFFEINENAARLEYITKTYLLPNIGNG